MIMSQQKFLIEDVNFIQSLQFVGVHELSIL